MGPCVRAPEAELSWGISEKTSSCTRRPAFPVLGPRSLGGQSVDPGLLGSQFAPRDGVRQVLGFLYACSQG